MHRKFLLGSVLVATALVAVACGGGGSSPTAPSTASAPYSATDLTIGTGAEATNGRRLTVNYAGWLYSASAAENKGTLFDTSVGRSPFSFTLGAGQVIKGWEQGVPGMKVGGVRRLVLPPDLAYGSAGAPPAVPGNATLVFEVALLDVQ